MTKKTTEKPKRLMPKPDTLRELFLKSGNLCAFPECAQLMMDAEGTFIGQVCHIEAAEPGGPRFNEKQTNEERRGFANLMLMCHAHHKKTDDTAKYGVGRLRKMKQRHESRFSDPATVIEDALRDWTRSIEPTPPRNLRVADAILKWGHSDDELRGTAEVLTSYATTLAKIPEETRRFLAAVVARMHRVRDSGAVTMPRGRGAFIATRDVAQAYRLRLNDVRDRATDLARYGLGGLVDDAWDHPEEAVRIDTVDGWPLWPDLATIAAHLEIDVARFAVDLDFSSLDG